MSKMLISDMFDSEKKYHHAIEEAINEYISGYGFQRREPSQDLIVFEMEDDALIRLIFFDRTSQAIYVSYNIKQEFADKLDSDEYLRKNFTLLYGKFGRDTDGQIDLTYSYLVRNSFCLDDFDYFIRQMENTTRKIVLG